jgi:iron-sulfur cluster assembly protein
VLQEIPGPENETSASIIEITDLAAEAINGMMEKHNLKDGALRIITTECGCGNGHFDLMLDKDMGPNDVVFDSNNVKVAVEKSSVDKVKGLSIDLVNDPKRGSGLVINTDDCCGSGGCSCGECSCR